MNGLAKGCGRTTISAPPVKRSGRLTELDGWGGVPNKCLLKNHDFDAFQRPRLHVWAVIVHGYFVCYTVSDQDVPKSGSTTVDILAYVFTLLVEAGVDLAKTEINLQLDNTSSTNKNNVLFAFCGLCVLMGLVMSISDPNL